MNPATQKIAIKSSQAIYYASVWRAGPTHLWPSSGQPCGSNFLFFFAVRASYGDLLWHQDEYMKYSTSAKWCILYLYNFPEIDVFKYGRSESI